MREDFSTSKTRPMFSLTYQRYTLTCCLLFQTKNKDCASGSDCHMLLPVTHVRDGVRIDRPAQLQAPQQISSIGVQGEEVTLHVAGENHPTCGGEYPRPGGRLQTELPLAFPRQSVQSAHCAPGFLIGNGAPAGA